MWFNMPMKIVILRKGVKYLNPISYQLFIVHYHILYCWIVNCNLEIFREWQKKMWKENWKRLQDGGRVNYTQFFFSQFGRSNYRGFIIVQTLKMNSSKSLPQFLVVDLSSKWPWKRINPNQAYNLDVTLPYSLGP